MSLPIILLLIYQIIATVRSLGYINPIPKQLWSGSCTKNSYALNDCNWCRCNEQHRFACEARKCDAVDMFGHFNDAIKDIDVGMEGRGAWRSSQTVCEPGMRYQRDHLLCVCDEDGSWPSPVCRDAFQTLYPVSPSKQVQPSKNQLCTPTKLYLLACNVCYCPSTGRIDPKMCTQKKCSNKDPVVARDVENDVILNINEAQDIYAQCIPRKFYKWDCRTCVCLTNNRLVCKNCTDDYYTETVSKDSYCKKFSPGVVFHVECNACYCKENGLAICTAKKCLPESQGTVLEKSLEIFSSITFKKNDDISNTGNLYCVPGTMYKRHCYTCYCFIGSDGRKLFLCDLENCQNNFHDTCVYQSVYEMNCLLCRCDIYDGKRIQICETDDRCKGERNQTHLSSFDSLHGYCEPLKEYKRNCNKCKCLLDGKTVICTTNNCKKPINIDLVPVEMTNGKCPKGKSYKVDCNLCVCLPNGNTVCTTNDCQKK